MSDVSIKFYNQAEMETFTDDMINRWRETFPQGSAERLKEDQASRLASSPERGEDDGPDDSLEHKEARKCGARGVKEFFEILFDTSEGKESQDRLDNELQNTDIDNETFRKACHEQAAIHLHRLGNEQEKHQHQEDHADIANKNLRKVRSKAKRSWPFIKAMVILTGHMLLRYGLCLYDLPGTSNRLSI